MKTLRLAALLAALATPAWAYNDPQIREIVERLDPQGAYDASALTVEVCKHLKASNLFVCVMDTIPLVKAIQYLRYCDTNSIAKSYGKQECAETRAYIKQRWGY